MTPILKCKEFAHNFHALMKLKIINTNSQFFVHQLFDFVFSPTFLNTGINYGD